MIRPANQLRGLTVDIMDGLVYIDVQRLESVRDFDGLGVAIEDIIGPIIKAFGMC